MLYVCTTCGCHVRAADASCPHCGAVRACAEPEGISRPGARTAAAALLDTNADINPGAAETPEDGIDSNCDEDDDT